MRFTNGYIMLPRELRKRYFYGDWAGHALMVYMLENAEWSKERVSTFGKGRNLYEVKFAEFATAKTQICGDLGINRGVLTRCIAKLKRLGLITESKRVNYSIFKINSELANTIYTWNEQQKNQDRSTNEESIINNKFKDISNDISRVKTPKKSSQKQSKKNQEYDSEGTKNIFDISENRKKAPPVDESRVDGSITPNDLLRLWNDHCGSLPKCRVLSDRRKQKAKARIKENSDQMYWQTSIEKLSKSNFANEGRWCSFDWLIKNQENADKAFNGNYDNHDKRKHTVINNIEELF